MVTAAGPPGVGALGLGTGALGLGTGAVGVGTGALGLGTGAVGVVGGDRQPSEFEFPNTCVHVFVPVSHAAPKWLTLDLRILALCPDEFIQAFITFVTLD